MGQGILEIFGAKSRGPPTYQIGLMHDPSQTPTQKHLTLPHLGGGGGGTGSENN